MKTVQRFARPIVPRRPFVLGASAGTFRDEMPFPSVPDVPADPGGAPPSGPADPTAPEPGPFPQDGTGRSFATALV